MKTKYYLYILVLLFCISCSDDSNSVTDSDLHDFRFVSLSSNRQLISVFESADLEVKATGDDLTYSWKTSEGTLVGSGAKIKFSICHATYSRITCKVTDKYNHTETKSVTVQSYFPTDSL